MKLYLDSSALVKLVKAEPGSPDLRKYVSRHRGDGRVTSTLARVEVVRAVAAGGSAAIAHARRQLARIDQVTLDRQLLDEAASIALGTGPRSLGAIHLCARR